MKRTPPQKIYLGGSIKPAGQDWREELLGSATALDLPEPTIDNMVGLASLYPASVTWPELKRGVFNRHTYVGPYRLPIRGDDEADGIISAAKSTLLQTALHTSDVVFFWLSKDFDYVAIAELGCATSWNENAARDSRLNIVIGVQERFPELEYVEELLGYPFVYIGEDLTPAKALLKYLDMLDDILNTSHIYANFTPIEEMFWSEWHSQRLELGPIRFKLLLTPQHEIQIAGKTYRLDFAHEASKTAIELDGLEAHKTTDQIAHDRKRQREIEALGWRFIRFGGKEIYQDVGNCVQETRAFIAKGLDN